MDLSPLFALQEELDKEIADIHKVSYESTFERRLLSLLVEVGEFANETRCFKYWSYKPSSPLEVVLEEYVDGLHFLLSLGIPLGVREAKIKIEAGGKDLTEGILDFYGHAYELKSDYSLERYMPLLKEYLSLLPLFGADSERLIASYKRKMEENHKRQATHY
ncbi:MAG: dUTP diphosphatase [Bacilli bacterium]|nr:dUTP diphosphatase [Bacilli bacterium]